MSIVSPNPRPDPVKIVNIKNLFSLLKPAKHISTSAKNTVAKGNKISFNNIDQVVAKATNILTTKLTTKTVTSSREINSTNRSN